LHGTSRKVDFGLSSCSSAPDELVRLAGYLKTVAEKLVIDLITVSAYDVGASKIIVPQRVDPEGPGDEALPVKASSPTKGVLSNGADAFETSIEHAKSEDRPSLKRLVDWARALEREGLVELSSFAGKSDRWILLPRLQRDNAGLVSLWNDTLGPAIQFWRSMFQKRAPEFVGQIEAKTKTKIGQGNSIRAPIDDELLDLLTQAYRVAAKTATKV
jgi:hypothetical protein